jgi:hypothetical protein
MKAGAGGFAVLLVLAGYGCVLLPKKPVPMPPSGPVANAEQAIATAINKCGELGMRDPQDWSARWGEAEWIVTYSAPNWERKPGNIVSAEAHISGDGKVVACDGGTMLVSQASE